MRRFLYVISIIGISTAPFLSGCASKKETHVYHNGHHDREVEVDHDHDKIEVEVEKD